MAIVCSSRVEVSLSYGDDGKREARKTDGWLVCGLSWDAQTARTGDYWSAETIAMRPRTNGMGGNACRAGTKIAMTAALASAALLSNALARIRQLL